MKRVFTGDSLAEVSIFKHALDEAGIACMVRNEQLGGGIGDIPVLDALPELWVLDDADAARAEALIAEQRAMPAADGPPWTCAHCGATNEPQFGACWQCERPAG